MALVIFGHSALFSSKKHLEKVDKLHTIILMNKIFNFSTTNQRIDVRFEESGATRQLDLTNHKTSKESFLSEKNLTTCLGLLIKKK